MSTTGYGDMPAQVRQVRRALLDTYGGLIDMADFESHSAEVREQALLSRALSALAVRMVTGWDAATAAAAVIDGRDDQGIDAIAVTHDPAHVYLVQAKWSDKGGATAKADAAHKLLAGLRLIDSEESAQFNTRGELLAQAAKSIMVDQAASVTAVTALMGVEKVSAEVEKVITNGEAEFNKFGQFLDHHVFHASDFWDQIRKDIAPPPVNMTVTLHRWFDISVPHQAFQGTVPAEDVASWLKEHGSALFDLNIRNPLGLTSANQALISTLIDEPSNFWYFNNGITVLCESMVPAYQARAAPQSVPVTLTITGASVVNGAQTVSAIAQAVAKNELAGSALVGVRVIATGGKGDLGARTTKATNLQNRVEARDFIALDPVQSAIRADLKAEVDKSYTIRRGEPDPSPDSGCSVLEAALALACAHPNAVYAARVAGSVDSLWERGPQGTYETLFRPQPEAFQVWNSVLAYRNVRNELHGLRSSLDGRAAAVVNHGTFLITHLVFRLLDTAEMDDPNSDWSQIESEIPTAVRRIVPHLVTVIDDLFEKAQIRAICADPLRCKEAAAATLERARAGEATVPVKYRLPEGPRRGRRPNAVPTIVDQGGLAEGEPLTLYTFSPREESALRAWLAEDPARSRATWVNNRTKPILWEADGQRYSPTGLISSMWEMAGWEDRPVANQGTARWMTSGGETLAELGARLLAELDERES